MPRKPENKTHDWLRLPPSGRLPGFFWRDRARRAWWISTTAARYAPAV